MSPSLNFKSGHFVYSRKGHVAVGILLLYLQFGNTNFKPLFAVVLTDFPYSSYKKLKKP